MLPRWTLRFFSRIFIVALGYTIRANKVKFKGRQANDPSSLLLGKNDSSALNSHIYRRDPVTMTPVHYQSALHRLWRRVYNLCLNHPEEYIIIYKDYLVSAFCRLFYQPDATAAYTFILGAYLVISVVMVFGSRDAPSLF